ncbi:hypothetical protein GCM10009530_75100 [Microbispora corallina]|uniref:Tyr recombinase domain-containing protein n=2 Tax=Microbispora corallina TaxID=83302 RepID=A0ABQ4G7Z2_9ACTN|nr:hypothetical protein Mco01_61850 [Microbispora corallina]
MVRAGLDLQERSTIDRSGGAALTVQPNTSFVKTEKTVGSRVADLNRGTWTWMFRRQTTPSPVGTVDKGTKGKRARVVPLIPEVRDLVARRLEVVGDNPDARLFTGPQGGRITTAVLRDATHWDDVVTRLGYEHLRRHDLRHTGLTWMPDAGVPVHVLRKIAGHGSLTTTQRYLHLAIYGMNNEQPKSLLNWAYTRPTGFRITVGTVVCWFRT